MVRIASRPHNHLTLTTNDMKARITHTGHYTPNLKLDEIVEIVPGMETDAEGIWNAPAGKLVLCRKENGTFCYASMRDMQIVDYDTTDWASFRREAAKDILAGWYSNPDSNEKSFEQMAKMAIEQADELIKQLKEEQK